MSFREPTQPLRDILESIKSIEDFTAGMTLENFREDPKTIAAVERKLLLIGEAAVRLGREARLWSRTYLGAISEIWETFCDTNTTGWI